MFNNKTIVGIDLGHQALKVVQVDKSPTGWRVTRMGTVPTPKGAIKDGIVTDTAAVGGALRQLLKQSNVVCKGACISVQGGSVVVRQARMPKMQENALRKSIRYEAGRYIPNSIEDSYVEFEILGPVDESQMDVLIVAAPRDLVDSRVEACRDAGVEVEIVDIGPFAAYRSLFESNEATGWGDETVALIDVGANSTTVSVISSGHFVMTRSIQSGSSNLVEALRTFFDLSPEDAQEGIVQLNLADLLEDKPKENPPLRVLHPYIDELVREIRRSINYYESQQVDGQAPKPVKTMYLTGGGAKLNGLDRYFSHKLGIEVKNSGVFDNPRVANFTAFEFGSGLEWSVASGLAMRPHLRAA